MKPLIELRPATNRKTPCHWAKVFGVHVLFSYETAMAFSNPGKGSFRRSDTWSKTTRKHLSETSVMEYNVLPDDDFEVALNHAIMSQVLRDKALLVEIVGAAVADKLVPEEA